MHISRVVIKNILGFDELEFNAGRWNKISGKNGMGKTTILQAIKAVFDAGAHDATLIRAGAEKGEIVLELDDGSSLEKTIRPDTTVFKAVKDGRTLPRPAELLRKLVDRVSANPLEFLTAKEADRVSLFLQSMPVTIDHKKLHDISGVDLPKHIDQLNIYQVFEYVHGAIFDDRAKTNLALDQKKKTIQQLKEAMPTSPDGAVIGGEEEIETKLKALDEAKDAALSGVHEKLEAFCAQVNAQMTLVTDTENANIDAYTTAVDAEIAELQKQLDAKRAEKAEKLREMKAARDKAVSDLRVKIANVTAKADAKRAEIKSAHNESCKPLDANLAILRSNRELSAKRAVTLQTIKTLEGELEGLKKDSDLQTAKLKRIEAYKSEVLANLPIPGLEVKDGHIYRDGVIFDRLNMAQRMDIAVDIAKLRAGDLGVICVDGIEALDSESLEIFQKKTEGTDLQFFVSRVSDQPFNIETDQPSF